VIATLLEELGIPSTIVILRTQMRGAFKGKIPSLAPFDHAIVYVPKLNLYLDGTAEYTGSTELPKLDLEALGLLVNRGDSQLVTLPAADPTKNVIERQVRANVAADGSAKLELDYRVRGSGAPDWRRRYQAEATRRDRINGDLAGEFPGFEILPGAAGITASNLEDIEQNVSISVHGRAPTFARKESGTLSMSVTTDNRLTPAYAHVAPHPGRANPRAAQRRGHLRDQASAGTKVVSAPPNARGDSPFGSYCVELEQPGQVTVKSRLAVKVCAFAERLRRLEKVLCRRRQRAQPQARGGP
jgi:hypothetical protein